MDSKDQKDIPNLELNKGNCPNDYYVLAQKLKIIKEIIENLEKNFVEKEI